MKKKPVEDPLHALWRGGTAAIDKVLRDKSVDINKPDPEGRTLLMESVLEKRADLAKLLLEHGADAKLADHEGSTALHFAAQAHQPNLVQLLLDYQAPVDARDRLGNTPLFKALQTYRGDANGDAIWALMLAGANPNVKNTHDVSAFDLSKTPSNYDLGQFFR